LQQPKGCQTKLQCYCILTREKLAFWETTLHICNMRLKIKEVAKQKGFSIDRLAGKLNVSRRTIYNWDSGNVTMIDILRVAVLIECSFYELIPPMDGLTPLFDENGKLKALTK
jgi:DNA-binding XRE family transcriptional regulator